MKKKALRPPRGAYALKPKMLKALSLIGAGSPLDTVAQEVGMSSSGLRAALKRSDVRQELLQRIRDDLLRAAAGAPSALMSAMAGPNKAASVAAARALLEAAGIAGAGITIAVQAAGMGCSLEDNGVIPRSAINGPGYIIDLRQHDTRPIDECIEGHAEPVEPTIDPFGD